MVITHSFPGISLIWSNKHPNGLCVLIFVFLFLPPHQFVQGILHVFIPKGIDDRVQQRGDSCEKYRHHLVLWEAGRRAGIDEDAVSQEQGDHGEVGCTGGQSLLSAFRDLLP